MPAVCYLLGFWVFLMRKRRILDKPMLFQLTFLFYFMLIWFVLCFPATYFHQFIITLACFKAHSSRVAEQRKCSLTPQSREVIALMLICQIPQIHHPQAYLFLFPDKLPKRLSEIQLPRWPLPKPEILITQIVN